MRTIQTDVIAEQYDPSETPSREWRRELAEQLRTPTFSMSFRRALAHRLRRTYLYLLLILLVSWVMRITVFESGQGWRQSASILGTPGIVVVGAIAVFYAVIIGIALFSAMGSRVREFET